MTLATELVCGASIPIGMLHVPINTILAAPPKWRESLKLPEPTSDDMELVASLRFTRTEPEGWGDECPSMASGQGKLWNLGDACRKLSFFPMLLDRALAEAKVYGESGFSGLMIENIAGPYFTRGDQPAVIYGVLDAIAQEVRKKHPKCPLGIQVLAFADHWAMDIAVRHHLDFIRCESVLFEGIRPEGRTPNHGNLAKLYCVRELLSSESADAGSRPLVFVDVQKKHTVFPEELDPLGLWLENILFQKLEGIVITGKATGQPVEESDLRQTREAIDKAKAETLAAVGIEWSPQLIVGSGASVANIPMCKRYADAVIVGSSLKKNGYWENPLEEDRVKRFMETWSK